MPNITDSGFASSPNNEDALTIIFKLKRMGLTQARLAQELAVSPGTINNVIHSRATCFPVAVHIAGLLGTSIHDLWPNRYVFKPRSNNRHTPQNKPEGDET